MDDPFPTFASGLLAAMLLWAAGAKALDRGSVAPFLLGAGLPRRLATLAAAAVVPVELATGLGLLFPATRAPALVLALVLGLAFVAFQARARGSTDRRNCRCFGALEVEDSRIALVRAAAFLALAAGALASAVASGGGTANAESSFVPLVLGLSSGVAVTLAFSVSGQVVRFRERRPRFVAGGVLVGRGPSDA